jgi:hypothetical protein
LFGKPRKRQLEGAANDLKKIHVRSWTKMARDINAWKLILQDAKFLHGP